MEWPVKFHISGEYLEFSSAYMPPVFGGRKLSKNSLLEIIKDHNPTFPAQKTPTAFRETSVSLLIQFWKLLIFVIIPLCWFFITLRILNLLFFAGFAISGLQLTFGFFLFLSFNFSITGIYALYRNYQNKLDDVDQLDLLSSYFSKIPVDLGNLDHIIEEKDGYLFWKQYRLTWDLNDLFPTLTILDFVAMFATIFNIIYIGSWLFSILIFIPTLADGTLFSTYVIIIDLLLIIVFVVFFVLGFFDGRANIYSSTIYSNKRLRFVKNHLIVVIIAVILLLLTDLIVGHLNFGFALIILLAQLPIFTSFVVQNTLYLRKFIHIKTAMIRQMKLRMSKVADIHDSVTYPMYVERRLNTLQSQTLLPTSRLRSYLLVFTAILSLFFPILTAFFSSIERFDDILRLIFPV